VRRAVHREWLTSVKGQQAVQLPAIGKSLPLLAAGHVIGDQTNHDVMHIEVARSVISFEVEAVLRKRAAISRDFIEAVRPGVSSLRGNAMEIRNPQRSLKRV